MNLFYASQREGHTIYLTDQEANHCTKVLRKTEGSTIHALDGKGAEYTAVITEIKKGSVEARIEEENIYESDKKMPHLAFGIIKHPGRLDWLIEKVTEVGVCRITPLVCRRSEKRRVKKERLEKIILSASKQSKAYHFPVLDEPMTPAELLADLDHAKGYIASWGPDVPELSKMSDDIDHPCMLIGPEGDFTDEELTTFVNAGFQRVNLGRKRLRAETACVAACTLLMAK